MTETDKLPTGTASSAEVAAFLRQLAVVPTPPRQPTARGRLMFALDATASRQPTWDRSCQLQGEMFETTAALGGLAVQLVFFRGYGECKAGPWLSSGPELLRRMSSVQCLAGKTQWLRVFDHALAETRRERINALVCVGDSVEEELDRLGERAGELGLLGVPVFLFQEGDDATARAAFQQMARLSGGACCRFDGSSARELRELLSAVATYAAGGREALQALGHRQGGLVRLLADQMSRPSAQAR